MSMLEGIKARLDAVTAFENRVTLAHEVDANLLASFEPKDLPAVVLLYGENKYLPRENEMQARQQLGKGVIAYLWCTLTAQDDLERQLVQAVLGFIDVAPYDHGLEAVSSTTRKMKIEYVARRIEFSQTTRVVGSA